MEEILASIRRIIADDEAKPASADKPANDRPASVATEKPATVAAPVAKVVVKDIPPSPTPAAAKPAPPAPKPVPVPPPAKTNSQDDIDAMLASLDEATLQSEVRPPQPDGDVFELTDEMALPNPAPTPQPAPPAFQKVEPQDDIEFTEATKAPPPRQPAYEPPAAESSYSQQPILSRSTMTSVESAFNSLANTVLSNNARTLEDLVKEMLRPMLKSWLDDNLPGLVERIVKAEIERVSRGR
jgi:cell pole-organizing protein PopZ